MAGAIAARDAIAQAEPVVLEPIMDVEVVVPEEYMGDVMADITSRRGKIGGMFRRSDAQVIVARVPLSEMFGYSTALRSLTQGRAVYTMQFSRYERLPKDIADEFTDSYHGKAANNS
jgi:elongation factor G